MGFLTALLIAVALVAGFAAGLLTFKRSSNWCPTCGATLRCPDCAQRPRSPAYGP
jgi:hypothetical protein